MTLSSVARAAPPERAGPSLVTVRQLNQIGETMNDNEPNSPLPPQVHSAEPEHELERKLKREPHNLDAKADVGSDESMDASDPPAAAQPGQNDEPVPSSGFPE
jgi:hypothetical protein